MIRWSRGGRGGRGFAGARGATLLGSVGALGAGATIDLAVGGRGGVPPDATGVVLNVTAIGQRGGDSFVTVWPTGTSRPLASNLNPSPGQPPAPNSVTVKLGTNGRVSVFTLNGPVHLLADVADYYVDHDHDDRYAKRLAQVVTVATAGGDFATVQAEELRRPRGCRPGNRPHLHRHERQPAERRLERHTPSRRRRRRGAQPPGGGDRPRPVHHRHPDRVCIGRPRAARRVSRRERRDLVDHRHLQHRRISHDHQRLRLRHRWYLGSSGPRVHGSPAPGSSGSAARPPRTSRAASSSSPAATRCARR